MNLNPHSRGNMLLRMALKVPELKSDSRQLKETKSKTKMSNSLPVVSPFNELPTTDDLCIASSVPLTPDPVNKQKETSNSSDIISNIMDEEIAVIDLGGIDLSDIQEINIGNILTMIESEANDDEPKIDILQDTVLDDSALNAIAKSSLEGSLPPKQTDIDEDPLDDSVRDPDWEPSTEDDLDDTRQNDADNTDDDGDENDLQQPPNDGNDNNKGDKRKGLDWQKTVNKRLRMNGKNYKGLIKVDGQFKFDVDRDCRKLKPSKCMETNSKCGKNKKKCDRIKQEDRESIFRGFWENMEWTEKKVYVRGLVDSVGVNERKSEGESRRQNSFQYYLKVKEERVRVCKSMFLTTLAIGEKMVYDWLNDFNDKGIPVKLPERRPVVKPNTPSKKSDSASLFFESIPKLPSHYCRSTSTKKYLEPTFSTKADLYRVYKEYCVSEDKIVCGRKLFFQIFDDLNLSIFSPKKDQCDLCVGHEVENVPEEIYTKHIENKDKAREAKRSDKERATTDNNVLVITLDLQALLMCPKLEASALYYKTKLGCHNYTIYNLGNSDVKCYFWHEGEGDLNGNSFASCLYDYLDGAISENITEVVIYSDGCTYQNRNVTVSQALLRIAFSKNVTIVHNYLERGHTQMEVDSIHSVIERKIRHKPIYSPQNYVDKIREARMVKPYIVNYISHDFFRDFSKLGYYNSIRPGVKVGDHVVTDLRVIKYSPDGIIQYKLDYDSDYCSLPRKSKIGEPTADDLTPRLHFHSLPIKKKKFEHLQALKAVIPKDYHSFYDELPHEN